MKIFLISNTAWSLVNFRGGLMLGLTAAGHEVVAVAPPDEHVARIEALGIRFLRLPMDNKGTHPGRDLLLLLRFYRTFRMEHPDVIIWDSLYNFGTGDLNKDQDMRSSLSKVHQVSQHRNPQRGIVLLHHATTGKGGMVKVAGLDRASFGRNSKVLHAWARAQVNVAPLKGDDNDLLAIACGKASNGREFQPFAARLNS